ncbi:uncharacterized protein LOC110018977 [Phalaenopsis equestris]|uniref:uncharacterized protein LOC110018977 n=1 Tax=Phalaenopsis equestris TaxID=78828 RepID=UPI0009E1929A|nr:uncharacterized protein LOC110018977 [Phalaenopsis equestris]XP_020572144.1 uncharacterized protein LOC110018977 [Phalaenopsis equestris]XP_020572145.1 uncharacterized protein LOC110018977 [Phalaenopsis equestris]XP_020572146.1 uncharacterized protein LOC110018977 [Phalaenopsis equestris]XP_020572147.1 uncharacterized protein LOC110018977 [Phalaenopsis equestris]
MGDNMHMEVQEDEEEDDLDFNPLLRGETLSEASSSLSSENEGPCDNVSKHIRGSLDRKLSTSSSRVEEKMDSYSQESVNEDEESIMQFDNSSEKSIKQLQMSTFIEARNEEISIVNGNVATSNYGNINEPIVDDNDDAICRRTRARHSLTNYTLEELEAFLQESEDDDELHNVDDEEEYHKFLTAVLLEGDENEQADQGERAFDEDEENDADFEVELEEALESDAEETTGCSTEHRGKQYGDTHVPETRQKKRLKEFAKSKKFLLGQSKATLRPILPYVSNSQRPPFPSFAWQMHSPIRHSSHHSASVSSTDLINGFTTSQIGQLYCLMHEHVQLLVQVFSVCVLDPSRQPIANDLQKLILELIERHEISLSWRKVSYPSLCFQSSNLHSSVQVDSNQSASCYWKPVIDNDSVLSILDVAPLKLLKNYLADIKETVSIFRKSCLEHGPVKSHSSKEPLFSLPMAVSLDNADSNFVGGSVTAPLTVSCQLQSVQQQPKKSLAATLVESTMKQSVALVPAIAKLAQRFLHLFNAALFPHKPPTPAVANRVLFTDAEDGLLAMGIMEHNNDWFAIQQHFLPCKSTHQIFVRQKNRSSSKAPQNPIKAVRRMKSSPLTEDEKAVIYEGLRIFKHDWLSVWKYFVPHRDPSMLPRQWRIATGTQKSYKKNEAVKERRRLYEAKRRRLKACMTEQETSEKEVNYGDNSEGDMDCEDEAYVHEAFLADMEAGKSKNMAPHGQRSCISSSNGVNCTSITNDSGESILETGTENMILNSSKSPKDIHCLHQFSQIGYGASYSISSRHLSSCLISGTSRSHLLTQSYRARKRKGLRIVKLAPDLPPVNLPPSVRVISQSAFKVYHGEPRHSIVNDNPLKDHALRVSHVAEAGVSVLNLIENTCKLSDNHHLKDNASESDVQLHPLLFQNPSRFLFNCQNAAPSSCNLLVGSQCSIGMVSTADPGNSRRGSAFPTVSSTDFHPLLQRFENNSDGVSADLIVNGAPSECQGDGITKLDLNIHLSSTMDMERTAKVGDNQNVELSASTSEERIVEKVRRANLKPFDFTDEELKDSREANLLIQSTSFYSKDGFGESHDISCHHCAEDFHEESNPGIVMEQEELSDSDDESANVVFECEDLEDSEEEEELCGDAPMQIQNKAQNLHQLPPSNSALHASVKRGKACKGTVYASRGFHHPKLTMSNNENCCTKGDRSCRSSQISISPSPACSKKRGDGENSILQDLTVGTAENKTASTRRSKCRSPLD